MSLEDVCNWMSLVVIFPIINAAEVRTPQNQCVLSRVGVRTLSVSWLARKMFGVKLLLMLPPLGGCLALVTHQLYDLTPAPYLNKHRPQYSTPAYLGYRDKPINVYRDTSEVTDQAELTDAIRTQDKDHLVSHSVLPAL